MKKFKIHFCLADHVILSVGTVNKSKKDLMDYIINQKWIRTDEGAVVNLSHVLHFKIEEVEE